MSDKKKGWDLSIVLALIAVLISVCTMIISLVETSIMQKQQQSMTESSKASVWPYVTTSLITDSAEDKIEFSYIIENKGVGPALIKNFELYYRNEPMDKAIINTIRIHCPDAIPTNIISKKIHKIILSPGEVKKVVGVSLINADFLQFAEFTSKISSNYCYANIYGDHWKSINDEDPIESKGCD